MVFSSPPSNSSSPPSCLTSIPISCCDSLPYFTLPSLAFFLLPAFGVVFPDLDDLGVPLPPAFGLKFSLCLLGDLDGFDFFLLGVLTADSSLPIIPFTSLLTVLMEVPALLDFSCCCGLFTNYYCFRATLLCVLLRSLDALDIELAPLLIGERRA